VLGEADLGLEGYAALGPMFQIRDDLLDFQEGKGRRNVGNDVRAGKRTLMVVHANDDRLYDILDKPYDETTEDDVERAVAILEEHGSMAFARETMADLSAEVRESLEGIPESPARDRLVELSEFITDREV
jgi:geranylgeranyl pyrophosphate synthase